MTEYHTSIVQLYATALFDYAVEQNMLNKISAEVTKFQSILLHDDRIIEVIAAPIHSEQDQAQLLQKIASFSNLSQEITNFIIFVAKNKRLLLVAEIFKNFAAILSKYSGNKIVEATVSHELSLEEQRLIKENLEKSFASKIQLSFKVDPKILAGIIIKIDNKMLDASLKRKFICLSNIVEKKIAFL